MKRLPIQNKVEVGGALLRVLMYFNKLWLCTEDLSRILGYRTNDGVLRAAYRHGELLQSHSIKGQIAGKGKAMRMFDEHAVRYLCEYSKRPGAFHLLRWLEEGGMRLDEQRHHAREEMIAAVVLSRSEVGGETLRLIEFNGRPWLASADVAALLGYRSLISRTTQRLALRPENMTKAKLGGKGGLIRLYSEAGVRKICELVNECSRSPRPGLKDLLKWLDEGGMQRTQQLPMPDVQEFALEEIELVDVEDQPKAPVLALVPSKLPPVPSEQQERARAYCRELLKTLLRYANDTEAEHLVQVVEAEVYGLLSTRYCQGLNDARYELYRRFWLQGGAK